MASYVVDASVAVKWLVDENLSDEAAQLLNGHELLAPSLVYAEATNAIWKLARRGIISWADVADALAALSRAPLAVPVTMKDLMVAAAGLAHDLGQPVYDCIYLALAIRQQRPVLTADRRFHDVVHRHPYLTKHVVHLERTP